MKRLFLHVTRASFFVVAIASCESERSESGLPTKIDSPPEGVVHLQVLVGNRSYLVNPVDIDIHIDGVHVIAGDFEAGGRLPFEFDIAAGRHTLRMVTVNGETELSTTFDIDKTQRWAVVEFDATRTHGCSTPSDPAFHTDFYDKEPPLLE